MNELVVADRASEWRRLKALVLDSVSSPITRRVYNLGLDEFIAWYTAGPRPAGFTKATVIAWRVALETRGLGPVSINVRITASFVFQVASLNASQAGCPSGKNFHCQFSALLVDPPVCTGAKMANSHGKSFSQQGAHRWLTRPERYARALSRRPSQPLSRAVRVWLTAAPQKDGVRGPRRSPRRCHKATAGLYCSRTGDSVGKPYPYTVVADGTKSVGGSAATPATPIEAPNPLAGRPDVLLRDSYADALAKGGVSVPAGMSL